MVHQERWADQLSSPGGEDDEGCLVASAVEGKVIDLIEGRVRHDALEPTHEVRRLPSGCRIPGHLPLPGPLPGLVFSYFSRNFGRPARIAHFVFFPNF